MTTTGPAPARAAPSSLRERKKLATRHALRRVAITLAAERGWTNVTVEDIAEAANVSPRTFFNYFPTKEAALFGADPEKAAALRERIATEAPGEPVLEVLRAVMASNARAVTEEWAELGGDPAGWLNLTRQARADPQVHAAFAAQTAMIERTMAEGIAARLGTDLERDPYPVLLAATATAAFRSSLAFWADAHCTVPLSLLIDLAFRALADGLPDRTALRRVTTDVTGRKDDH